MSEVRAPTGESAPDTRNAVVTCFLRHRGEVLLVRRSGRVGSYRGRWGAVSGFVEADGPLASAWREIEEETGLLDAVRLVRQGEPFDVDDAAAGRRWRVHPFLFDADRRDARLDWEASEGVWVPPTAILTRDAVPRLWASYQRVAPDLQQLREDRRHGSAYLSLRALEVLRDRAAVLASPPPGGTDELPEPREPLALARALRAARPAMTAVRNRIDRAVTEALAAGGAAPAALAVAAQAGLEAALAAEDGAAAEAARLAAGRRVLTLSLSGTVALALESAAPRPARVVVSESRPGGEGRALADRLSAAGIDAVVVPDAAIAWALERERVELVLVGADTVLPDGAVVNKVGTRLAALAARAAGVRCLAVAARDKIAAAGSAWSVESEGVAEQDGATGAWRSPVFERTPAGAVSGVATEMGVLGRDEVAAAAREHARWGAWDRRDA